MERQKVENVVDEKVKKMEWKGMERKGEMKQGEGGNCDEEEEAENIIDNEWKGKEERERRGVVENKGRKRRTWKRDTEKNERKRRERKIGKWRRKKEKEV